MLRAVRPRPRQASLLRCALCHDELAAADPCAGCGTLLHAECSASVRSCPTRGCRGAALPGSVRAPQAGLPFLLVGIAWSLVAPLLWLHWGQGTMVGFFDAATLGATWVAVGVALSGIALDALAARLHRG